MDGPLTNNFEIPNWAGKPPVGLHLDVFKDTKRVQKLMIDEKKCYFFGRNKQLCDFSIDHQSCSRVHCALVWHKHLERPFLIDLGSTHGTYVGRVRLEAKKPQNVSYDSEIHFGASQRIYVIRERISRPTLGLDDEGQAGETLEGGYLGLPETELELDNLTEFNTAHNRRTSQVNMPDAPVNPLKRKRKLSVGVSFHEEDVIINPEDIDPTIGRFRNLVQTAIIPTKKGRIELLPTSSTPHEARSGAPTSPTSPSAAEHARITSPRRSHESDAEFQKRTLPSTFTIASKLGLKEPNLAPNVDEVITPPAAAAFQVSPPISTRRADDADAPRKKKYPTEAWPGKRPTGHAAGFL